ncbi:hypothetical protein UO65_2468 [Actinokineospora spheciospongiae]|uniref:DUF1501 domain-containing protein n=1 Tax=Actinokineospora spheciospongiae TaxID=909613 RepID=W7J876_9PSEU|nr:DUF1501 domain-containing protein [Actinokineospora spheciospongiae]EWC62219.1 hypothetical protein UO65_2468 [Actinokineospora spheciospongiae]
MDSVTRRRFLTLTGVAGAGALAAGATRVDWGTLMTAASDTPLDPGAGVLVVVTLYGGNDGLNTVVPAGDAVYQDLRSDLAYRPEEVLDLGEGLGLNPGMTGFKGLWDQRRLAVVRGVGYPEPDRSHFRSMAIWQTATPGSASTTGWLGRWLDTLDGDPLHALSVEPVAPPLFAGEKGGAASFPVNGLTLPGGNPGKAFKALGHAQEGEDPWRARAAKAIADLHRGVDTFAEPAAGEDRSAPEDEQSTKGASAGGGSALGRQLAMVANLIEAGVPTRAYSVSLGGFDTHADERGTQQRLLTELDGALTPFADRMRGTDRGRNVVVLVYSEFGRRVRANAGQGTDHGTAGPVFLLGEPVAGGFHGEQPGLADLDGDDLKATTDFRDVYATLLGRVLAADPARVLDGHRGNVDHLIRA